ncbi:MAG: RES family NAD+ phosphorylase [Gammaproteobacteria bacterium]|nr:RES family NAD+ phosphorylase [Gammaproteobacteria bacterium]
MNTAHAHALPTISLPGATWYRAVDPAFASAAPRPSARPTRFNSGPAVSPSFRLLYFAPDPLTALFEVEALLGSVFTFSIPNPSRGALVVSHSVPPLDIIDLGDPVNRSIVDTTRQEMTGDWRLYRHPSTTPAPTQEIARAVHQAHPAAHAILAPSARNPSVNNLVVFYDRVLNVP